MWSHFFVSPTHSPVSDQGRQLNIHYSDESTILSSLILSLASHPPTTFSWFNSPLDFSSGFPTALLAFRFCLFSSPFFPKLPGNIWDKNLFLFLLLSGLPGS